jgi:uncharacterized membrane protein (UPF0127 family)
LNKLVVAAVLLILIAGTVYGGYLLLRPTTTLIVVTTTMVNTATATATAVITVTTAIPSAATSTQIVLDGVNLYVEIASTPEAQQRGLSGRTSLAPNHGMLFDFTSEGEGTYGFWMPDMRFPLDIIWFNAQRQVVYIQQNLPPCPPAPQACPVFAPPVNALYVLEVNAGFVQAHNVSLGDTFNFVS